MQTIPVKRFSFNGQPAFRFPYRTARATCPADNGFPKSAVLPGLFDDNHQCTIISTEGGAVYALYNSDGRVRVNDYEMILSPTGNHTPNEKCPVATVHNFLLCDGFFVMGEEYTYEVTK